MHMYRLEGSYRAIGREYGMLLRASRVPLVVDSQTRRDFADACEPFIRQHAPDLLDEIEGIAEGGGYDLKRVKAAALVMNAHPGCTLVAISGQHTTSGKPIFGRNHDWFPAVLHTSVLCETHPDGALAGLGVNDALVGRMDGINAAGLAIGIASVQGGRDHPGIMFHIAARIVLDRCRSTVEAVEFLQTIRHARSINFLVADASGGLAAVEAAPGRVCVIRPDNGFLAAANQFQSDEMAGCETVRRRPPNSYRRLCALREWFAAQRAPISAAMVQGILSAPYPNGVCARPMSRGQRSLGTVWSWTAELGSGQMAFAEGSPAEVPYRVFGLG
jgi:predicted choloylglycine hydrolase